MWIGGGNISGKKIRVDDVKVMANASGMRDGQPIG